MSNAAAIAELIVEGGLIPILDECRKPDGKLDIVQVVKAFQARFPDFDYDDIVQAIDVATELMVADLNSAAEGL